MVVRAEAEEVHTYNSPFVAAVGTDAAAVAPANVAVAAVAAVADSARVAARTVAD